MSKHAGDGRLYLALAGLEEQKGANRPVLASLDAASNRRRRRRVAMAVAGRAHAGGAMDGSGRSCREAAQDQTQATVPDLLERTV